MTTKAFLTWAYDGSGIALRVPVDCLGELDGQVSIIVTSADPDILRVLSKEFEPIQIGCDEYHLTVPARMITPVTSAPDIQSWNWND